MFQLCVFTFYGYTIVFINSASNAPLYKTREPGAGRYPLVQLQLLWVSGRQSLMRVLNSRAVTNREENNMGYLIGRYSCSVSTAAFLFATFDRQQDDDEQQIYAIK